MGRPEIYVAAYHDGICSSHCLFDRLEPAVFFVVSGLGSAVDWSTFPDPAGKYPYEERNGNPERYTPAFVVRRQSATGREISGTVTRMAVADIWVVGNGIAEGSKKDFFLAFGKDMVKLAGEGDKLQASVT